MKDLERTKQWLVKEIRKCEREIENEGPFYVLEARKQALEEVQDRLAGIEY